MRNDIIQNRELIDTWVNEHKSKSFMCEYFRCRPSTLDRYLKMMGIEYKGNMGGKGIKSDPKRKSAEEYSKSSIVKSHVLKMKLIQDGLKQHRCEICELTQWLGTPIPIELHHIDGNRFNNDFGNLQILCPNCHSQTPNYSGKKLRFNKIKKV